MWGHKRLGALFIGLALDACQAEEPSVDVDAAVDAGMVEPVPPAVELGGGFLRFEPLRDGQQVELVRGPQSLGRYYGFHLWLAVRARGFEPQGIAVKFVGTTSTATIVDTAFMFNLEPYEGGYEAKGFRGLISDCCAAKGRSIDVALTLTDRQGQVGHDHRRVIASDQCIALSGAPPVCPD